MTTYEHIGDAYDLVYTDASEKIPFVAQKLREYQVQSFLELGSGSGLFAIPLKYEGFDVDGLEISQVMIAIAAQRDPSLSIHCGDMRAYALHRHYDAILAVSSVLVLLKDQEEIQRCLHCCYNHLKPGGLLLLELPNHAVEVPQKHHTQEVYTNHDRSTIVVIQSLCEAPYWREYWTICRKSTEGFKREEVTVDEFLYTPAQLEQDLKDSGFDIMESYGDLFGNPFDAASSWRRVWLCKKV